MVLLTWEDVVSSSFFFLSHSRSSSSQAQREAGTPSSSRRLSSTGGALRSGKRTLGKRVCIQEDCEWVPKAGHLKKNDFYEIFALIRYQFSQMPFQYLPPELYEIIVSPTAGG